MTPKFITSCYVRIEDKDKRKEVLEELDMMGYNQGFTLRLEESQLLIWVYRNSFRYVDSTFVKRFIIPTCESINCNLNTSLFLALASMRSDTDKGQIFIANKDTEAPPLIWGEMFRCSKEKCDGFVFQDPRPRGKEYFIGMGLVRRATAPEIINHHKQKGE